MRVTSKTGVILELPDLTMEEIQLLPEKRKALYLVAYRIQTENLTLNAQRLRKDIELEMKRV